jgi:regulator of sirC expression with transglutaminase-like and TPR domain
MAVPWHFMARFHDERGAWLLDPFHGVVLAPADAAAYLSRIVGRPVHLASPAIAPAGSPPIALRILNNLRNAYTLAEDPVHLRRVLDFQVAVLPQEPELWRERALLQFRLAEYEGASYSVRRYFAVTGRLAVLLESVRQADQPALSEQDRQLRELHRQVNLALARSN